MVKAEVAMESVRSMVERATNEMRAPDFLCVDPATFKRLVPNPGFTMESPVSGTNMSGDSFLLGCKVVFVKKSGVQLGYRLARRLS